MLHKCANPACSNPFRRLNDGKLFQVEKPASPYSPQGGRNVRRRRRVEHYWLCDDCSALLTLAFEKGRGLITVPLPQVEAHGSAVDGQAVTGVHEMDMVSHGD